MIHSDPWAGGSDPQSMEYLVPLGNAGFSSICLFFRKSDISGHAELVGIHTNITYYIQFLAKWASSDVCISRDPMLHSMLLRRLGSTCSHA